MANAKQPSRNHTKSKTPARGKSAAPAGAAASAKVKVAKEKSSGRAPALKKTVKSAAGTSVTAKKGSKAMAVKKSGSGAASKKAPAKAPAAKKAPAGLPAKRAAAVKAAPPAKAPKRAVAVSGKAAAQKKATPVASVKSKPARKAAESSRKFVTTSTPESIASSKVKNKTRGDKAGPDNGATMQDGRYALPAAVNIDLPHTYKPSSKEEYMGPRHLQYFRNKLSQWRADLVEESRQTIESLRDEVRDVGDEAERATRETENSLELRTRDRYRKLIAKIDKALKRIEEGHYGFCEETDEEIGLDRLEARPIATLSLDAQERWEHRQKQMGD